MGLYLLMGMFVSDVGEVSVAILKLTLVGAVGKHQIVQDILARDAASLSVTSV
jgi:hypothetical protein